MIADRKATILAGILYFPRIIAGALSVVPLIGTPDYLNQISAYVSQVTSGASFQFLMARAYLGMAITLYPLLKKHNESLALGYVGFRIVAVAFNVIGVRSETTMPIETQGPLNPLAQGTLRQVAFAGDHAHAPSANTRRTALQYGESGGATRSGRAWAKRLGPMLDWLYPATARSAIQCRRVASR